jgi:hypothetical protein
VRRTFCLFQLDSIVADRIFFLVNRLWHICATIHYLQTSQTAQQIVHDGLRGWVSVEDVRAYLYSRRLYRETPVWNLSDLYSAANSRRRYVLSCQLSRGNAREVLDYFRASSDFIGLSDNSARNQMQEIHQISLVLPSADHRILPLRNGPPVEPVFVRSPTPLSQLQAERRDDVEAARQSSFNRLLESGLLANSLKKGKEALDRLSEVITNEER